MKKLYFLISMSILLTLSSCLRSVYPLFENNKGAYLPALNGEWIDNQGKTYFKFIIDSIGENTYRYNIYQAEIKLKKDINFDNNPTHFEPEYGDTCKFIGNIDKLGKSYFINLSYNDFSEILKLKNNFFYQLSLIPGNIILKLDLHTDSLTLATIDYEYLIDQIKTKKCNLELYPLSKKDENTLVSDTKKIQKYLVKNYNNDKLFSNKIILYKK